MPSLTQEKGQLMREWVASMRTQITQQLVIVERLAALGELMAEWDLSPQDIDSWVQTELGAEVCVRGETRLLVGFDMTPLGPMLKRA